MAKLQSFIKTFARTSTVDIICEADSSHITRKYFYIEVAPPGMNTDSIKSFAEDNDFDPALVNPAVLRMKVCANCFTEWLGTIQTTLAEYSSV